MKQFESFRLDTADECLWHDGVQIALPPKQFALLRYLVEHPGRLISHDELLDALWPETYVQPQVLRTYVLELRRILGDDARQPRFIQSLPKRGYRFVAPVTETLATPKTVEHPAGLMGIAGRGEELGILGSHFERLASEQRQIVFVCGEVGIGKTALVEAFCRELEQTSDVAIVRGQCVQGFAEREEYYPVMEMLAELCAPPHAERAQPILARSAPAWHVSPDRDMQAQPSSEERALSDLCVFFEGMSAERPLVLVFEDLQWADASTLHLLAALARRRVPARLMVVATQGPTEQGEACQALKKLKHDLLLHGLGVEIALTPLQLPQVRELVQNSLNQQDLPQDLAASVYEASEGNPLFALAILEHLKTHRFLVRREAGGATRWEQRARFRAMEVGVPEELEQMVELEIERLTAEEQRLLEAGSLFSVAFPAWAVAAAMDDDVAATEEMCDELARRLHFIKRAGQDELPDGTCSAFYVFAHGLYREVLHNRQAVARRSRSHLRIAEKLRASFAGCESHVAREMAWHYEAAGQRLLAIATLRDAARNAVERNRHAVAADFLEHALRIAEDLHQPERDTAASEILMDLTQAKEGTGCGASLQRETQKLDNFSTRS